MTPALLTQLVSALSGARIVAFFLVLARVTPLFFLAPVFSSQLLPPRVKGIVAVSLAIALTPLAAHGQQLPTDVMSVAGLMIEGMLVGLAFAFAVACVFAAIQGAGQLADASSGFSYGSQIDPINGNSGGSMSSFYNFVGLAVFLAIGGDAWMLRGVQATFRDVPIGSGPQLNSLVGGAEQLFGTVFIGAVEVAAPMLLALLITDIGFGMVAKVVPQINIFAVGFPVKVGVALLVATASLPFFGSWMTGQLDTSVGAALRSLSIG